MTPSVAARGRAGRILFGTVLAALLATPVLAGCSATRSESPSSANGGAQDDAAPQQDSKAVPGGAGAGGGSNNGSTGAGSSTGNGQQTPVKVAPALRSLIFTGTISVRVPDVAKAADQAVSITDGVGGLVGSDRRTIDADRSEAELTLRVPAERFASVLNELGKLGTEITRAVRTEDVTEALIDIDARIATQKASVARVRALMDRANSLGEITSIEAEVTRREAELASLQLRKDKLAGQVALSTITLSLHGPAVVVRETESEPETGFMAGLRSGWKGFLASVKIVLTVVGWLLPWFIAIGAPVWLLVFLLRRSSRRRSADPSP